MKRQSRGEMKTLLEKGWEKRRNGMRLRAAAREVEARENCIQILFRKGLLLPNGTASSDGS